LQAIAITDHHDMAFVSYIRRAAEAETNDYGQLISPHQRLVVFPGMELTLGVPCQALLIFDADFPEDMFSLAMTALLIEPSPDINAKAAAIRRLDRIQSLKQLKDELDKYK
jgi:type III restriction enzyme